MLLLALQLRSPIGPYVVRLTSAYCTKYKDSYESAHLLSAGLCLALDNLPTGPLQVLQNSPPPVLAPQTPPLGSADSSTLYIHPNLDTVHLDGSALITEPCSLHTGLQNSACRRRTESGLRWKKVAELAHTQLRDSAERR